MGKLSPMMQQYFEMKKDYPDTLLFFRLGDFYEMFFDDARTASRELDLVLTGRDCGLEERAPMCGVPFHSADSYIAKLVAKGYKIAICEQMEDPAAAKGLVRRDVVRVITPGTVIEGNMLDEGRNNYLCAISMNAEGAGLCFADASTGEIHITVLGTADLEEKLLNELSTYSPREILVNQHLWQMERVRKFALDRLGAMFELLPDEKFDFDACQKLVVSQIQADKIGELDVQHSKNAVCALGVVVDYLRDTHKHDVDNVSSVDFYDENQYMKLDMAARRNLELTKTIRTGEKKNSLLWVLDKTKTPMGKRLLRNWLERPLMNLSQITRRQNGVDELVHNTVMRSELTELLARISDVERLMTRVVYNTANARELRTLAATIELLPRIKSLL